MNRPVLRRLVLDLIVMAVLLPAIAHAGGDLPPPLSHLSWLAGDWTSVAGDGVVEESWLRPKANLMIGMNRTVTAQAEGFFEFMRIAWHPSGITFTAWPQGSGMTEFRATEISEQRVVFENPAHDFPRRVIYWRKDDGGMGARIEGTVDGRLQSQEWDWRRP
jgi:hypothetical protein